MHVALLAFVALFNVALAQRTFAVAGLDTSDWTFSGTTAGADPEVFVQVGDTVVFTVSTMQAHEFAIHEGKLT
jgi:hypothetical protein